MEWITRNCPSCSGDLSKLEIEAPLIADKMSFEQVSKFWRGFRHKSCFFSYSRCVNCGLLYNKFYFNLTQLELLYSSMPDNSAGVEHKILSRTQLGYLNFCLDYLRFEKSVNLLELGPDVGLFTFHADNSKQFKSITLIEPNLKVHESLRKSITKTEKVFLYDDLSKLDSEDKFDLIVGIHVFDHLIEPSSYIEKVKKHLNPGGYILSVTHDESSFLRKLLRKKWIPFCLQHPQLFNSLTIERMFAKHELKLIKISKSTNWFPVAHIINTFLSILNLPMIKFKYFEGVNLPFKFGNMISLFKLNN